MKAGNGYEEELQHRPEGVNIYISIGFLPFSDGNRIKDALALHPAIWNILNT